ncbi:hypothetical protein AVEN_253527-1 [Araneus ventricosus]|uniref:Uncharacterized protein n=1 Tax=Araneus ventricosus TaxID=182803 RepID=A0A4Y2BUD4_ARAVE|nr:hypothetical protein AVEN_253527-1 [Araneus ventricosus]
MDGSLYNLSYIDDICHGLELCFGRIPPRTQLLETTGKLLCRTTCSRGCLGRPSVGSVAYTRPDGRKRRRKRRFFLQRYYGRIVIYELTGGVTHAHCVRPPSHLP